MDCYAPWPARSSWPSCHPRDLHGSGPLRPMGLPSEPPFPHNVPLGGCHWLLGLVPAACPPFLCSFNTHIQPRRPGMGAKCSVLACPFLPGLPRVLRPFGKRENSGGGAYREPSSMKETIPTSFPRFQCSGDPAPSSRWPGKIWR